MRHAPARAVTRCLASAIAERNGASQLVACASPIPPSIEPDLRAVRKHLRRAESALESFDLDGAERAIDQARDALEPVAGRPEAYEQERKRPPATASGAHGVDRGQAHRGGQHEVRRVLVLGVKQHEVAGR